MCSTHFFNWNVRGEAQDSGVEKEPLSWRAPGRHLLTWAHCKPTTLNECCWQLAMRCLQVKQTGHSPPLDSVYFFTLNLRFPILIYTDPKSASLVSSSLILSPPFEVTWECACSFSRNELQWLLSLCKLPSCQELSGHPAGAHLLPGLSHTSPASTERECMLLWANLGLLWCFSESKMTIISLTDNGNSDN